MFMLPGANTPALHTLGNLPLAQKRSQKHPRSAKLLDIPNSAPSRTKDPPRRRPRRGKVEEGAVAAAAASGGVVALRGVEEEAGAQHEAYPTFPSLPSAVLIPKRIETTPLEEARSSSACPA